MGGSRDAQRVRGPHQTSDGHAHRMWGLTISGVRGKGACSEGGMGGPKEGTMSPPLERGTRGLGLGTASTYLSSRSHCVRPNEPLGEARHNPRHPPPFSVMCVDRCENAPERARAMYVRKGVGYSLRMTCESRADPEPGHWPCHFHESRGTWCRAPEASTTIQNKPMHFGGRGCVTRSGRRCASKARVQMRRCPGRKCTTPGLTFGACVQTGSQYPPIIHAAS